jgi:hypothetical protein
MPDLSEFRAFLAACEEDADVWTDAHLVKAMAIAEDEYNNWASYVLKHTPPRAKRQPVELYLLPTEFEGVGRLTQKPGGVPLPGVRLG